jgi:hypothetical protein
MSFERSYEIILPILAPYFVFWPDIYALLLTSKRLKEVLYLRLPEIHYCPQNHSKSQPIYSSKFQNIFKASFHGLTSKQLSFLSKNLLSIRELTFTNCTNFTEIDQSYPLSNLKVLSIHCCSYFYVNLIERSPQLHTLVLESLWNGEDEIISFVQTHCPDLQVLTMKKSFFIVNPALIVVTHKKKENTGDRTSRKFAKLRKLSFQECPNFKSVCFADAVLSPSDEDIHPLSWKSMNTCGYSSLTSLNLSSTPVTSPEMEKLSHCFPHLQELFLINCWRISSVLTLHFPSLHTLDLSNCRRLASLSLSTPQLEDLKLVLCSSLQSISFETHLFQLKALSLVMLKELRQVYLIPTAASCFSPRPVIHRKLSYIDICGCSKLGQYFPVYNSSSPVLTSEQQENEILENLFQFPSYQRVIGLTHSSKKVKTINVPTLTIPLVDWVFQIFESCPSFNWKRFFSFGIGSTVILTELELFEQLIQQRQNDLEEH